MIGGGVVDGRAFRRGDRGERVAGGVVGCGVGGD